MLLTRIMEIFKVIPLLSRRHRKRVTPLPITISAKNKSAPPSKTIKEEAEEYKQKLRAMRLKKEAKAHKLVKPSKLQRPHPAREHPNYKEPSRFSGVFKEWWNDRAEIIKYHYQRIKRDILPTIFCIKVEVDD